MGQTTGQLKTELEQRRADVSADLEALGDRVSPGRMADRRRAQLRRAPLQRRPIRSRPAQCPGTPLSRESKRVDPCRVTLEDSGSARPYIVPDSRCRGGLVGNRVSMRTGNTGSTIALALRIIRIMRLDDV